jgi:hypothetical protein
MDECRHVRDFLQTVAPPSVLVVNEKQRLVSMLHGNDVNTCVLSNVDFYIAFFTSQSIDRRTVGNIRGIEWTC